MRPFLHARPAQGSSALLLLISALALFGALGAAFSFARWLGWGPALRSMVAALQTFSTAELVIAGIVFATPLTLIAVAFWMARPRALLIPSPAGRRWIAATRDNGSVVWLNLAMVVMIERAGDASVVTLAGGGTVRIQDAPDSLLASVPTLDPADPLH